MPCRDTAERCLVTRLVLGALPESLAFHVRATAYGRRHIISHPRPKSTIDCLPAIVYRPRLSATVYRLP